MRTRPTMRAARAICALVTLLASGALAASPALAAPVWTQASSLSLPANATSVDQYGEVRNISCANPTACVSFGSYLTGEATSTPMQIALAGDSGHVEEVPSAAPLTDVEVIAVACTPAGACTAAGTAKDESTSSNVSVIITDFGTPAVKVQAVEDIEPALPASVYAELDGIDCSADGECVAVGSVYDSETGGYLPLVVTGGGGAWHAKAIELPSGASSGGLNGVACASTGCEAIGNYYEGTSDSGALAASSAESWSTSALTPVEAETVLDSISCNADGHCVAIGYYENEAGDHGPLVATLSGGASSVQKLTLSPESNGYLESVSCPAEGACTAAGEVEPRSSPSAVVASEGSSGWSLQPISLPANGEIGALDSITCAASGDCTAVGWYEDAHSWEAPMTVSETNGTWESAREVELPGAREPRESYGEFDSVACPAVGECTAVGTEYVAGYGELPIVAMSLPSLEVVTTSLPAAQAGEPYSAQLAASGGSGSYSWSVSSGSLPAGLSINSATGVISGTPINGGSSSFAVQASDPGPPAQSVSSGELTLRVAAAGSPPNGIYHSVPAPKPVVRIESRKLTVASGKLELRVACKHAACDGTLAVVARLAARERVHGKAKVVKRSVVLGTRTYTLAKGKAKTFALKVAPKTRKALVVSELLERTNMHGAGKPLKATVTITVKRGTAQSKALKIASDTKLKID